MCGLEPGVGGPAPVDVVHPEHAVVPDHVHDPDPAGHGVGVALPVGGEEPVEEALDRGPGRPTLPAFMAQSQARPSLCSLWPPAPQPRPTPRLPPPKLA